MSSTTSKFVIVGQGLAGTVLAFLLSEEGFDVCIIDNGHASSSSMVAAGMWNPVSFKKLNRSWIADELLPAAYAFYPKLEAALDESFFHPTDLVRIFPDTRAANEWDERSVHPELSAYLTSDQDDSINHYFAQPHGHGVITQAGWLNIPKMILSARKYFSEKNMIVEKELDQNDIDNARSENATVIFCNGWKRTFDKRFDWLDIIPNKGELLTVHCGDLHLEHMVNFGKFLIPLGEEKYRLGATYELYQDDVTPSAAAKANLMSDFQAFYSGDVEILDHKAGYRPTVPDRKPLIGFHPQDAHVGIFNGFGSKGVMLVPFFAQHFIRHLSFAEPLMKDVDIARYWKRHNSSFEK